MLLTSCFEITFIQHCIVNKAIFIEGLSLGYLKIVMFFAFDNDALKKQFDQFLTFIKELFYVVLEMSFFPIQGYNCIEK